jgi:hypothetical protein
MDEQAVREHAQAHADALLAGDIGKAAEYGRSQGAGPHVVWRRIGTHAVLAVP